MRLKDNNTIIFNDLDKQEEIHMRRMQGECDGYFCIGSVNVFCNKKRGHKGKCFFKTEKLEMKWDKE